MHDDKTPVPTPTLAQLRAEWICGQLRREGKVTATEYAEFCKELAKQKHQEKNQGENVPATTPQEASFRSDFTSLAFAIVAAGQELGVPVQYDGHTLSCEKFEVQRDATKLFKVYASVEQKEAIGRLVARFLKDEINETRSVFLGSGSTVYWVGRAMAALGKYAGLWYSVNIPLISYWSELAGRVESRREGASAETRRENLAPPVGAVRIPEGDYLVETCRYDKMLKLSQQTKVRLAVVGADGCYFDSTEQTMLLFANSGPVADNTNAIINMALHAVVCCLTSDKISQDPPTGPGPDLIKKPAVVGYLVTDKRQPAEIVEAFRRQNWHVVTPENPEFPATSSASESDSDKEGGTTRRGTRRGRP